MSETVRTVHVHPRQLKAIMKIVEPNRWLLYSAGWRSGFTVNGLRA